MYQPYPQGGEMPPDPARPAPPRPVRTAVLLMYVGAALSAVSLIVTVLSFHAIERVIRNASSTLTTQQVHNDAIVAVTIAVAELLLKARSVLGHCEQVLAIELCSFLTIGAAQGKTLVLAGIAVSPHQGGPWLVAALLLVGGGLWLRHEMRRFALVWTEVAEEIKAALSRAPVLHHDKTGLRVARPDGAGLQWTPVTSTKKLTYYARHAARGVRHGRAGRVAPGDGG